MSERIVVGVDGTEASRRALMWAIGEAALRGAAVEIVHAWTFPVVPYSDVVTTYQLMADSAERAAVQLLETAEEMARQAGGIEVRGRLVQGEAGAALAAASRGADLLVVGCRGLGAIGRMLLGSVSQHCLHHAQCPVVVVPESWRPADAKCVAAAI